MENEKENGMETRMENGMYYSIKYNTTAQAAIDEVRKWASESYCHISGAPVYSRGFSSGFDTAREIIREILAKHGISLADDDDDQL